jgi:two-component system, LytTR family, sensor kinase
VVLKQKKEMTALMEDIGKGWQKISAKKKAVLRNCGISVLILATCLLLTLIDYHYKNLLLFFGLYLAFAILFFTLSVYFLLPKSFVYKRRLLIFAGGSMASLAVAFVPCVLLSMLFIHDLETSITYAVLITIFQAFITLPIALYWYRKEVKDDETILSLQKELGQSNANFDLLRSQINPHFLFNALNTIYGTALQEGAERTGEGIERLADMMRFMLRENVQTHIPLSRELDYLRHYIELQKLRTAPHTSVAIETLIPEAVESMQIAPMLLIPFVENAFKHGISFRQPSHIRLSVKINGKTIEFELSNSIHVNTQDPEKNNSGIGLNNVKQRLELLYRGKHELCIRNTGKEFYVHLEVELN